MLAFDVIPRAFERIALDQQRSIAHSLEAQTLTTAPSCSTIFFRSSQVPWLRKRSAVSLVRAFEICHVQSMCLFTL